MRTGILCLPRTGSQYCENLISSLDDQCTMLGEYLEGWNISDYSLNEDSLLVRNELKSTIAPFSINSNYNDRLELLRKSNKEQNFTIRMFVFDDYDMIDIVHSLNDIGFGFVSLQRDFYSIAMSYTLALNYAFHGTPIWAINSEILNPVTVDIPSTKRILDRIYRAFNNWNENLAKLNVKYHILNYDSLVTDVTSVFGTVPKYQGIKTVSHDYSTHIINKGDVLKMMDSYASGL